MMMMMMMPPPITLLGGLLQAQATEVIALLAGLADLAPRNVRVRLVGVHESGL